MKIALIRLSHIGDIVFCMASVQLIRRHVPDASIVFATDSRFADIPCHNPDVAQVVPLDLKGLHGASLFTRAAAAYRTVAEVGKCDVAIDMHGLLKTALVTRKLGDERAGFHRRVVKEPLATLFYDRCVDVPFGVTIVKRYADLVAAALGFCYAEEELARPEPYLFFPEAERTALAPWFSAEGKNVIFIPGSTAEYKNYPLESLAEVAMGIGENVLVIHGNDREREGAEYLASRCRNVRVLPRMSLSGLKAAIASADLVIGADTGPLHMAWGCDVPSLGLFGATVSHCTFHSDRHRVLTSGTEPREPRPDSSDFSVRSIPPAEVVRAAEEILGKRN